MNHTPGPWRANWDDSGYWYIEPLGITGYSLRGDSGDCMESANAHLIAAAPELLEALSQALTTMRLRAYKLPKDVLNKCESAIKKAEGRYI